MLMIKNNNDDAENDPHDNVDVGDCYQNQNTVIMMVNDDAKNPFSSSSSSGMHHHTNHQHRYGTKLHEHENGRVIGLNDDSLISYNPELSQQLYTNCNEQPMMQLTATKTNNNGETSYSKNNIDLKQDDTEPGSSSRMLFFTNTINDDGQQQHQEIDNNFQIRTTPESLLLSSSLLSVPQLPSEKNILTAKRQLEGRTARQQQQIDQHHQSMIMMNINNNNDSNYQFSPEVNNNNSLLSFKNLFFKYL